jgi:hypothetical protein
MCCWLQPRAAKLCRVSTCCGRHGHVPAARRVQLRLRIEYTGRNVVNMQPVSGVACTSRSVVLLQSPKHWRYCTPAHRLTMVYRCYSVIDVAQGLYTSVDQESLSELRLTCARADGRNSQHWYCCCACKPGAELVVSLLLNDQLLVGVVVTLRQAACWAAVRSVSGLCVIQSHSKLLWRQC